FENGMLEYVPLDKRGIRRQVRAHSKSLDSLGVAPDGDTVVTAGQPEGIRLWRTDPKLTSVATIVKDAGVGVTSAVAVSDDARLIAVAHEGQLAVLDRVEDKETWLATGVPEPYSRISIVRSAGDLLLVAYNSDCDSGYGGSSSWTLPDL